MERRLSPRINISAKGIFCAKDNSILSFEYVGQIEDISESGINICFDKSEVGSGINTIRPGDEIPFKIIDNYELYGTVHDETIQGTASVVRINTLAGIVSVGCKFTQTDNELLTYINNRKTSIYMNSIKNRQYLI